MNLHFSYLSQSTLRTLLCALPLSLFMQGAQAGLCDVPFMHDGGAVQLQGSGLLAMGADLQFSEVKHLGGDQCSARVQGVAQIALAGLPASRFRIDYWMQVRDGRARFERDNGRGGREPVQGSFDLRLLGLFAYEGVGYREGQTFSAQNFAIQLDRKSQQMEPLRIHTGEKVVGARQQIQTALGVQSCWPIRYKRDISPTQASFNGIRLPVPGMSSDVTDWFCPDSNMVLKQESVQQGVSSTLEVTRIE